MAGHCCLSLSSLPTAYLTASRRLRPPRYRSQSNLQSRKPRRASIISSFRVPGLNGNLIISPDDQWGMWTALFAAGAFGTWSERNTATGKALSGALVSTLVGLSASSLGIVASQAPAYSVVLEYLLPLSIPLLLYNADLRRILKSTGTLLIAFLLGSVATTIGTLVAYMIVPMRSLGQDNWKIAAALMSRHIGGETGAGIWKWAQLGEMGGSDERGLIILACAEKEKVIQSWSPQVSAVPVKLRFIQSTITGHLRLYKEGSISRTSIQDSVFSFWKRRCTT